MSIYKINSTDYQAVTVLTKPSREYSSSSLGTTGSIYVFPRRSTIEKEFTPADQNADGWFNDSSLENNFNALLNLAGTSGVTDVNSAVEGFLKAVNAQKVSTRKRQYLEIKRTVPSPFTDSEDSLSVDYLKKLTVKENLDGYYKYVYPSANWAYCNYNSINFFSSSTVSDGSALVYPNIENTTVLHDGYTNGVYSLSGAFSFDFYVNPRYKNLDETGEFKAGTIMHLSSSYALSLVTGSLKDYNGLPLGFRLVLQLSHSADIPPSAATAGGYPNNLIFFSEDNSLTYNNWHHVIVRWGTDAVNQGTGSFLVDSVERGTFVIPSGTVAPLSYGDTATDPSFPAALFVGNYYEGSNTGVDRLRKFFTSAAADSYGIETLDLSTSEVEPSVYSCTHPLKAELHDLSIKRYYMTDMDVELSGSTGPDQVDSSFQFYLPPYFIEDTPIRKKTVWPSSGVPQTLIANESGTTAEPFNIMLAFGADGHYINLENYVNDFANNNIPRFLKLSLQQISTPDAGMSVTDNLYAQEDVRKRNLTILPCDDGNFYPNYGVLSSQTLTASFSDDYENFSIGLVNLNKMVDGNDSLTSTEDYSTPFLESAYSFSPTLFDIPPNGNLENHLATLASAVFNGDTKESIIALQKAAPLFIPAKTKDKSSNSVTMFDISNLYYGMKISPGTFEMSDSAITGSGGIIGMKIKDDSNGTLYRADSSTAHCTWNAVGTIFYEEGIIVIKNPHLNFFGKHQYKLSFKGEQNMQVLRFDVVAPSNQVISSSNPTFISLPSSMNVNEYDKNFVYISGINFHDDNLNVVMKTQLAQPVMKRHSDKYAFKVKYDW
jgi:hypothetical protein